MYIICFVKAFKNPFKVVVKLSMKISEFYKKKQHIQLSFRNRYWLSALFGPDPGLGANSRLTIGLLGLITLFHNLLLLGYKILSDSSWIKYFYNYLPLSHKASHLAMVHACLHSYYYLFYQIYCVLNRTNIWVFSILYCICIFNWRQFYGLLLLKLNKAKVQMHSALCCCCC